MRLYRLQRVAGGGAAIAIVDCEQRTALPREPCAALMHHRGGGGRGFDDRAFGAVAQRRRYGLVGWNRVRSSGYAVAPTHDDALAPAVLRCHILMDGQRVEKFIGDDDQRQVVRQAVDLVMMLCVRQARRLRRAQRRARLDEVEALRLAVEAGGGAQRVGGKRAAPRPQFDIMKGGAARTGPQVGDPDADHFAEHLADFGRRGEIARGAERVARRVIMRVRRRHIIGDRHRPRRGNFPHQIVGGRRSVRQRCRTPRRVRRACAGPWRSRRAICRRAASARSTTGPSTGRSYRRPTGAGHRVRGNIRRRNG